MTQTAVSCDGSCTFDQNLKTLNFTFVPLLEQCALDHMRQIIMETHHGVVLRRYIVLMILTATGSSLLFPGNNPGHTTLVEVITFPKGNYIFCCYTYPLAVPTSGENRTVQYWTAQPENNGFYCIS